MSDALNPVSFIFFVNSRLKFCILNQIPSSTLVSVLEKAHNIVHKTMKSVNVKLTVKNDVMETKITSISRKNDVMLCLTEKCELIWKYLVFVK